MGSKFAESKRRATLTKATVALAPPLGDASAVKMLLDRGAEANAKNPNLFESHNLIVRQFKPNPRSSQVIMLDT